MALGLGFAVVAIPGWRLLLFSRSLGVCSCLMPACLFLQPVEKKTAGILLFYKIDLSLNLILPTYVFKFYNLIDFEICLRNFKSGLLSFWRGWVGGHTGVGGLYWSRGVAVVLVWLLQRGKSSWLNVKSTTFFFFNTRYTTDFVIMTQQNSLLGRGLVGGPVGESARTEMCEIGSCGFLRGFLGDSGTSSDSWEYG